MEQEVRIRSRNSKIKKAILSTLIITAAGLLNGPMLVSGVLRELNKPKAKRRVSENAIYNARRKLAKDGLIKYENGFWRVTDAGRRRMSIIEAGWKLAQHKNWDKKWRVLIFDIKEKRKAMRDRVRLTLLSLGFRRLQDSVWVFPYDCEGTIALLKANFRIGRDLLYIIADSIENDIYLREEFGLS